MAAVGAPEVITQLESAAKVLMVRKSALFSNRGGWRRLHLNSASGGVWRSEAPAVVCFFPVFVGKCVELFLCRRNAVRAMRGALPCLALPVSIPLIVVTLPPPSCPRSSFLSQTSTTLNYPPTLTFGHFPAWLSCPETSAGPRRRSRYIKFYGTGRGWSISGCFVVVLTRCV